MMPQKLSGLFLGACLLLAACNPNAQTQTTDAPQKAAPVEIDKSDTAQNDNAKDVAQQKNLKKLRKLADAHLETPPLAIIKFKPTHVEGSLSFDDAERSYAFARGKIHACLNDAIFEDFNLKGSVTMKIRYDGPKKASCLDYQSDIVIPELDACLKNAIQAWPLPEAAELAFQLEISTRPGPTSEDLKKYNQHNGHNTHEHEHEHAHEDTHEHAH